mgnify:CR=1 FL=1
MLVIFLNVKCFAADSANLNILYKLFDVYGTDDAVVLKLGIGISSADDQSLRTGQYGLRSSCSPAELDR